MWRTSSFTNGGNACVEIDWRKAAASNGCGMCVEMTWQSPARCTGNGTCVEVGRAVPGEVWVRDSKHPEHGHLVFSTTAVAALVAAAKAGELDDLA
jgi:hypothetical protein